MWRWECGVRGVEVGVWGEGVEVGVRGEGCGGGSVG